MTIPSLSDLPLCKSTKNTTLKKLNIPTESCLPRATETTNAATETQLLHTIYSKQ